MKIKSATLGILLSSAMDLWITESTKIPDKIIMEGAEEAYDPEDIKGSYTFGDVSELFDIPLEDMAAAFDLPKETDAAAFKSKDLETIYADQELEVGTGSVRLFVSFYKGLPY